jgi:hypothetical protein
VDLHPPEARVIIARQLSDCVLEIVGDAAPCQLVLPLHDWLRARAVSYTKRQA